MVFKIVLAPCLSFIWCQVTPKRSEGDNLKVYMRFLDPKEKGRWLNEIISLRVKVHDKLYSDEYGEYENLYISAYDENGIYHEICDVCDIEVF